MFKVALKLIGRRLPRLFRSLFTVMTGIGFLAGTLMFTDTIRRTFDGLFADVFKTTDAYVQSSEKLDLDFGGELRDRLPETLVDDIRRVPGVTAVAGYLQGGGRVVGKDGKPLGPDQGPPNFISSILPAEVSPWRLTAGSKEPAGPNEVVLATSTAKLGKFKVGEAVTVTSGAGTRQFTVVGFAKFGESDSAGGGTFALFDLKTTQEMLGSNALGKVDAFLAAGDDGLSQQELVDRIAAANLPKTEVITGKQVSEDTSDQIKQGLSFFSTFLLAFAGIALFVSSFIIYNTFAILMTQRRRETALLRAVGASRRQILLSTLGESAVVGLLGGVLGIGVGVLMAAGVKGLLKALNIDIPSEGLALLPRTAIVAVVVAVIVSTVSALFPSIRAANTPPVAALRDVAVESSPVTLGRIISGLIVLTFGAVPLGLGLAGRGAIYLLGIAPIFIGLFILGPVIAQPIIRVLGVPLKGLRGVTGTMATENSTRNAKRSARTAAALLVGVALITGVSVISSSVKKSINDLIGSQFTGNFVVEPREGQNSFSGLSPNVATDLAKVEGVETVSALAAFPAEIDGKVTFLVALDPATAGALFTTKFVTGSYSDLGTDAMAISDKRAANKNLTIGDTETVKFLNGEERQLTITAIYEDKDNLFGSRVVSKGLQAAGQSDVLDLNVFIKLKSGVAEGDVRAAVDAVAAKYPNAKLRSQRSTSRPRADRSISYSG